MKFIKKAQNFFWIKLQLSSFWIMVRKMKRSEKRAFFPAISYLPYAIEAAEIVILALILTFFLSLLGASQRTFLVILNMSVLCSAALHNLEQKHPQEIILGSFLIVSSIAIGGLIGFYLPSLSKYFAFLYIFFAFFLPKSTTASAVSINALLMFLIFSLVPFQWSTALAYLLAGLLVLILFTTIYLSINREIIQRQKELPSHKKLELSQRIQMTLIALISFGLSWIIAKYITIEQEYPKLFWMGLSVVLIVQGSHQRTIIVSIKRIFTNGVGAIIAIYLFGSLIPEVFWMQYGALFILLFFIFFTGFSFALKSFFIEIFVLGIAYLIGLSQTDVAEDRLLLTLTAGLIVIGVTLFLFLIKKIVSLAQKNKIS